MNSESNNLTPNYLACGPMLSATEAAFYRAVLWVLPHGVLCFAKVRLIDLIKPAVRNDATATNKIIQKHVDFVLVNALDFEPIATIELDDKSHQTEKRQVRDAFVDGALASAGIPLIRIQARMEYNPSQLAPYFEGFVRQSA